jgi:hypothetical protein
MDTAVEPTIELLSGLWRRSLIAWPDGRRDTATWVNWLQGENLYIDLRQPIGRPDFAGVGCLAQLGDTQLAWIARQEGFAGTLRYVEGVFEWQREIDFQPATAHADRGHLRFEHGRLVEEGANLPYVEHWQRETLAAGPLWAVKFADANDGRHGFLLRHGGIFMYARGRSAALPSGRALSDLVAQASSLQAAQDLIDCEISQGTVASAEWVIRRSSLPFREGHPLDPRFVAGAPASLVVRDVSRAGRGIERRLEIIEREGPTVLD